MVGDILLQAAYVFRRALEILVIVRMLMSWFRPRSYSRQTRWFFRAEEVVDRLTEPFLEPIRRILPTSGMGIDFSPIVLYLLLRVVFDFIVVPILSWLPF